MEIQELFTLDPSMYIKIGKTSITVKDNNDKTRGIIKNVWTFGNLQFNKQVDINILLNKIGLNGKLFDTSKNLLQDGKQLYYLFDIADYNKTKEDILKYGNNPIYNVDFLVNRLEKFNTVLELLEGNETIKLIKCNIQ